MGLPVTEYLAGVPSRDSVRSMAMKYDVYSNDTESVSGDVRNSAAVDRARAGVDSIIHLAAVNDAAIHHDAAEHVSNVRGSGLPRALYRPAARASFGRVTPAG